MHSPTLRQKFQADPWPCEDCDSVLFLLDVTNSFEEALLREWIDTHLEGRDHIRRQQVALDLSDDRKGIDSSALVIHMELPESTLVAPLRIAWLPTEEAINSGPRLSDLVFGDPRRPTPMQGKKIIERNPQPARTLPSQIRHQDLGGTAVLCQVRGAPGGHRAGYR